MQPAPFRHYAPVYYGDNDKFVATLRGITDEMRQHHSEWRSVWEQAARFFDRDDDWMQAHFGDLCDGSWSPAMRELRRQQDIAPGQLYLWHLYVHTKQDFVCPCCGRSKAELVSETRKAGRWQGRLVSHHDHAGDEGRVPAFPRTLVCDTCNEIESGAKKILRAPSWFSFSPAEIRAFIEVAPNRRHEWDMRKAKAIMEARLAGAPCDSPYGPEICAAAGEVNADEIVADQVVVDRIRELVPGLTDWQAGIYYRQFIERSSEDATMQHNWVLSERRRLRERSAQYYAQLGRFRAPLWPAAALVKHQARQTMKANMFRPAGVPKRKVSGVN